MCRRDGLDPLTLSNAGTLLLALPSSEVNPALDRIARLDEGIATWVGEVRDPGDGEPGVVFT